MDWFIADTHFNDNATIRFIPPAYLDAAGIEPTWSLNKIMRGIKTIMIQNFQKLVSPEDTVYHLGDVGRFDKLSEAQDVIDQIPGRKVLVMGNHDYDPSYIHLESGITSYVQYWYDAGFDEVHEKPTMYNEFARLSHEPPFFSNYPQFALFGHVHTNPMYRTITPVSCCVSADRWRFAPVSINYITRRRNALCKRGYGDYPDCNPADFKEALDHIQYIANRANGILEDTI